MRNGLFLACATLFCCVGQMAFAIIEPPVEKEKAFEPFTGKVTSNKVRLRNMPNLDGQIIKELKKGDMLVVLEELDEFFAVQAPADIKAFIFRTYVLDNQIEGNHVNVRLAPDLESPIIVKLNAGDPVENAKISSINSKWYEISPPTSTRFYISKDYVEKIGNASLMATLVKRDAELSQLLQSTLALSQEEMKKAYPEVKLDTITKNYHTIIQNGQDFPQYATQAKEQLAQLQEEYLNKKIAYLEVKAFEKVSPAEAIALKPEPPKKTIMPTPAVPPQTNIYVMPWEPKEESLYEFWISQNGKGTLDDFYVDQQKKAVTMHGTLEYYNHAIKNRPGDYILLCDGQPIAYLYSTTIDLEAKVGNEISIEAVERPNNHFAYPAYYVLNLK